MLADYQNNQLMLKWYEIARTREKRLFKKVDVFMYVSVTQDDAFDLLYVSFDEINRRMTRCYHGKFAVKMNDNYLIIRKGLWRKRFLIIAHDDENKIVVLSNKRKSMVWILSKELPYDRLALADVLKSVANQGVDMSKIEYYYE